MNRMIDLEANHAFKASHSLEGFETPHHHVWKIAVCLTAPVSDESGRIVDLVFFQNLIAEIARPFENQYLNTAFNFSPTSENIAKYIWDAMLQKLKTHQIKAGLKFVRVTNCSLEGEPLGSATVYD